MDDIVTISYKVKWRLKDYPHIKISKDKRIFNSKTNTERFLKVKGVSGLWVTSKIFIKEKDLNSQLELIPKKEILPF